jgi:hypothetical protein
MSSLRGRSSRKSAIKYKFDDSIRLESALIFLRNDFNLLTKTYNRLIRCEMMLAAIAICKTCRKTQRSAVENSASRLEEPHLDTQALV